MCCYFGAEGRRGRGARDVEGRERRERREGRGESRGGGRVELVVAAGCSDTSDWERFGERKLE